MIETTSDRAVSVMTTPNTGIQLPASGANSLTLAREGALLCDNIAELFEHGSGVAKASSNALIQTILRHILHDGEGTVVDAMLESLIGDGRPITPETLRLVLKSDLVPVHQQSGILARFLEQYSPQNPVSLPLPSAQNAFEEVEDPSHCVAPANAYLRRAKTAGSHGNVALILALFARFQRADSPLPKETFLAIVSRLSVMMHSEEARHVVKANLQVNDFARTAKKALTDANAPDDTVACYSAQEKKQILELVVQLGRYCADASPLLKRLTLLEA